MKIRKNDTIKIIKGKDHGKTGKVLRVDYKNSSVIVEGLNLTKKHRRPKKQGEKGEIISVPQSLDISKIMVICPQCKQSTRVGYVLQGKGKKARSCKKCGGIF